MVQNDLEELLVMLDEHASLHSEEYYYQVRQQSDLSDPVSRAARFVFLNKTGYNGLMRYNSRGEFNTPWGHKKNPVTLYFEDDMKQAAAAFRTAKIKCRSYSMCRPKAGDFVYLDPPYDETYNGYDKSGFGVESQKQLAAWCRKQDKEGVLFLLSNSDTPLIRELYQGFEIIDISAPRMVSCKADGRKPVQEVLVRNYHA